MPRKKRSEVKRGKLSRAAGVRFELKVRNDLESDGWFVDKWNNNVDLEEKKLVKAKPKFVFNPQLKRRIPIGTGSGFPDFVGFKPSGKKHTIIGVEVRSIGYLKPDEKKKCMWYLKNKIFSKILIAKKGKKRGEIEYIDFNKKYILNEIQHTSHTQKKKNL